MIQATIQTRTMDKSYWTQDKIDSLVTKLKSMIDADEEHFKGFIVIEHGSNCPDESTNFFDSPGIKKYADLMGSD